MTTQNPFRILSTLLLLGVSACDPEGAPELLEDELLADELEAELYEIDAPVAADGSGIPLGGLDEINSNEPEATEVSSVDLRGSDFNGDGFADLAMGAPGQFVNGVNSGAVIVSYGGPGLAGMNTIQPPLTVTIQDAGGVPSPGDEFGLAMATGDFNLDSFDDLAIGAPSYDTAIGNNAGAVMVIYGSPLGLDKTTTQLLVGTGAPTVDDRFGAALAAQDFSGDGAYELAVGAPGRDIGGVADAGRVEVFAGLGGAGLLGGPQVITQALVTTTTGLLVDQVDDQFGAALAAGNFNGDARHDLAIGIPGDAWDGWTRAGSVAVLYGLEPGGPLYLGGAVPSPVLEPQLWHQNSPGIVASGVGNLSQANDEFGSALVAGNFDGNPYDDLAIGIPREDVQGAFGPLVPDAGAVMVLYSTTLGLGAVGSEVWHQDTLGMADASEQNDQFGKALAAGQLDALGWDDLAIGVPGEDLMIAINAGMVHMIFSSPQQGVGLAVAGDRTRTRGQLPDGAISEADAAFGSTLSIGDYNQNGVGDLAIGSPLRDNLAPGVNVPDAGEVTVLWGPTTAIAAQRLNKLLMLLGVAPNEKLGAGLPAVH